MNDLLKIDTALEKDKIVSFIKIVLHKQDFKNVVIGMSGGIDSTTSFSLLTKAVNPENIFPAHLYYFKSDIESAKPLFENAKIPQENIYNISIKNTVDSIKKTLNLDENHKDYKLRFGNVMARTRMIILYDLAKQHQALVCGTENKSEKLLGYFTRFGDEASDFEPIQHLYKTQVYQLAKYLKVAQAIIDQTPTAGLWEGQTDEGEFGFSYKEADNVLRLHFDKKLSLEEIIKMNFPNAKKIIDWVNKNSFKHHLPYTLKQLKHALC